MVSRQFHTLEEEVRFLHPLPIKVIKMRNAAAVRISNELLLSWLQFEGGSISGAIYNARTRNVDIFIDHPDLPEVKEGDPVEVITPSYTSNYDNENNLISVNRIDPPKSRVEMESTQGEV